MTPPTPSPASASEPAPARLTRAEKIDAATPANRNRVVDLLRALAITVVVLGHWTIIAVDADGGLQPHGVLDGARWTHPLTWVFQVMPIFFLVGGYSNALSWRSARRKDTTYVSWLRARLRRLGIPLVPVLITWLVICAVALAAGADAETVRLASQMALIPTWFLASYLLVIMVAPPLLVVWERIGWWSVLIGIALAGAVDFASIALQLPVVGFANYLLVWAAFHQIGFAWLDGRLTGAGRRVLLATIGAAGLAVLVGLGPYPVSMITAGGDAISNSNPTRVTMAFLGLLQAGLVLLLEKPLAQLMTRPRLWMAAVVVNMRIMSWFLWHLTAMVGTAHLLLALAGRFPALRVLLPEPLSGPWWASRPLWCLTLIGVTLLFVAVMGRFETVPADERPSPPVWQPILAAVLTVAGLAVLASVGMVTTTGHGLGALAWWWAALPIIGIAGCGIIDWGRGRR
ncbi:acyltransferase family protein [Helcobacillus massiliensis]|uniref:acyltransferase family protein n=1 Tax=Helcobacillus massiliensis TaxID=521392 RepID=UPI002554F74B|nr:acyltransferase [Helcobacillus massiliensis]MDK7742648.1 acyltransferase [Helcobacillus massiliensis]WOO92586.1 acyltransferase [Helcobacillus massiliensis]